MRRYMTLAVVVFALSIFIPAHAANQTVRSAGGSDPTGFFAPAVILAGPSDSITLINADLSFPHTWLTSAALCKNPLFPFVTTPVPCNIGGTNGIPPGGSGVAQLSANLVSPIPTAQNPTPNIYEFYCNFHSVFVDGRRVGMVGRLRLG